MHPSEPAIKRGEGGDGRGGGENWAVVINPVILMSELKLYLCTHICTSVYKGVCSVFSRSVCLSLCVSVFGWLASKEVVEVCSVFLTSRT